MILFFKTPEQKVIATAIDHKPSQDEISALQWLYGDAEYLDTETLEGRFIGPRREMVTPWSTNAVEITQNMCLSGISRIEEYTPLQRVQEVQGVQGVQEVQEGFDPMLQRQYDGLNQEIFTVRHEPEPIKYVDDLEAYNEHRFGGAG